MYLKTIFLSIFYFIKLLFKLLLTKLSLPLTIKKARKAFEKELRKSGMPKEAVKTLGASYTLISREIISLRKLLKSLK